MTKKTLLFFQLFLALFSAYTILDYYGSYHMLVPFFCLVSMFLIGRYENDSIKREE